MHSLRMGFIISAILLSISAGAAAGAGQSAENMFNQGTQSFATGDYEKALGFFQAADRGGLNSSALRYNLGVTYFKLQRYSDAQKEFEQLTTAPETAPLAHYNLGRVALAKGDTRKAKNHFKITYRTAMDEKLRGLADDRLRELSTAEKEPIGSAYLSASGGYDDNVALIADSEERVGDVEDNFMEYVGSATGQLIGTRENGLQLKGYGYYLDYFDADEFDFGNLRIGPELDRKLGQWNTSLAGYLDWSFIDKEQFEQMIKLELKGSREIYQNLDLRLKYQLSVIDAEEPNEGLTGTRHRMTAGLRTVLMKTYTGLDYTLELNDRDDPDFPTRHTVSLLAERDLTDAWRVGVDASYRYGEYQLSNRVDQKWWLELQVSRSIPWGFRAFGKYDRINNVSNLDVYDYTSNVFTIGLERFF